MKVKILNIIDDKTFKAEATLYKPHKKFLVHYEGDRKLNIGEEVVIVESRPISKTKRWVLTN
jgi:ribosomal protein S17